MKFWILIALMDIFLFCAYWVLFIKAGLQRILRQLRGW